MNEKRIQVAFNVRSLCSEQIRGISRYTIEVLKYLGNEVDLFLFSDREIISDHLNNINYKKLITSNSVNHFIWEQVTVPYLCLKYKIDIYHCPSNFGTPVFLKAKAIVTIHDAIDFTVDDLPIIIKFYYFLTKKFSNHFITVSEHSKRDLVSYLKLDSKDITVIPEASFALLENLNNNENQLINNIISEKYFFYVGGWEKRKNISFLIDAFNSIQDKKGYKLIIAGEKDHKIYEKILKHVENLNLTNEIILFKWLSDNELASLYKNAACFVYPSLYEGFGLQICEAMNFDIPVIASNATSLPEVLANDEALFSPTVLKTLTTLMERLINETEFKNRLTSHSKTRKLNFSWESTSKKTLLVYKDILQSY